MLAAVSGLVGIYIWWVHFGLSDGESSVARRWFGNYHAHHGSTRQSHSRVPLMRSQYKSLKLMFRPPLNLPRNNGICMQYSPVTNHPNPQSQEAFQYVKPDKKPRRPKAIHHNSYGFASVKMRCGFRFARSNIVSANTPLAHANQLPGNAVSTNLHSSPKCQKLTGIRRGVIHIYTLMDQPQWTHF